MQAVLFRNTALEDSKCLAKIIGIFEFNNNLIMRTCLVNKSNYFRECSSNGIFPRSQNDLLFPSDLKTFACNFVRMTNHSGALGGDERLGTLRKAGSCPTCPSSGSRPIKLGQGSMPVPSAHAGAWPIPTTTNHTSSEPHATCQTERDVVEVHFF